MNKTWTIIIVILVIAAGVWWFNGSGSNVPLSPGASASPTAVGATKKPVVSKTNNSVTPTPIPVATSALSYSQLVAQYGNNRIQFDANCQAQPGNVVFKNGTKILLDNRSNQPRSISVNNINYNLGAYGYQVILLSSSTLPQTIKLGCNGLVNVGTIQLQANISGQ